MAAARANRHVQLSYQIQKRLARQAEVPRRTAAVAPGALQGVGDQAPAVLIHASPIVLRRGAAPASPQGLREELRRDHAAALRQGAACATTF